MVVGYPSQCLNWRTNVWHSSSANPKMNASKMPDKAIKGSRCAQIHIQKCCWWSKNILLVIQLLHVLWATPCISQTVKPSLNICLNRRLMQGWAEKWDLQTEALDSVAVGIHWPSSLAYKGNLEGSCASVTCLWEALKIREREREKAERFTQAEWFQVMPPQMCNKCANWLEAISC